jgi:hypothetical protein
MYLPQYHEIKENNEWWGEGYTEWTAVKRGKPLFKGHRQPNIPLNDNYYDLSDENAIAWKWQVELAQEYGIYGFCVYHYWFNGKQLLEKPLEILLHHPEININYSICWANETWTRTWYGNEKEILIKQEYGSEADWEKHFTYLLSFFKDKRYIKIDNKPVLNIYRSGDIECLAEMLDCWNNQAINNGFDGIYIVVANNNGKLEERDNLVDAYYNFEPTYTLKHKLNVPQNLYYSSKILIRRINNRLFKKKLLVTRVINSVKLSKVINKKIEKTNKPVYRGVFTRWDNTPRMNYAGMVCKKASPELFYKNLLNIKETTSGKYSEFIYVNAWNEWGEGCYLEPDTETGYQYLEKIKEIVNGK